MAKVEYARPHRELGGARSSRPFTKGCESHSQHGRARQAAAAVPLTHDEASSLYPSLGSTKAWVPSRFQSRFRGPARAAANGCSLP